MSAVDLRKSSDVLQMTTRPCPACNEHGTMTATRAEWQAYFDGAFAQDAFPTHSAGDREQIISGTHSKCWDAIFSNLEDEDYDNG